MYNQLIKQIQSVCESEKNYIANAANISAVLYHNLEQVNWCGFYFFEKGTLVLGPFQGQVACTRIPLARGVCGTAYAEQKTQLVADVHQFVGHIACDSQTISEVVVPFQHKISKNIEGGVVDIDSPIEQRFVEKEKHFFEDVAQIYVSSLGILG